MRMAVRATRWMPAVAGIAIAGLLVGSAVVFSHVYGTRQVASHAAVLHRAEAALGAAAVTRALVGDALLLHRAELSGLVATGLADRVRGEAEEALAETVTRIGALEEVGGPPVPEVGAFAEAAGSVLGDLAVGRIAEAEAGAAPAEAAYQALVDALVAERDERARRIQAAQEVVGRAEDATRFSVGLALPLGALLVYRGVVRRRQERAELEAERELSRAKDEFIAGVSHQLRTPLTAVYGFAEVLEAEEPDDPSTTRELIRVIAAEAADLSRMVDDLVVAGRVVSDLLTYRPEDVPVTEVARRGVTGIRIEGQDLRLECAPARIRVDPERLAHLLRNLLHNAVRHGGRRIRLLGQPEDGGYRLSVTDDGPGLSPEDEGRVFQPLSHRDGRALLAGTFGLGLSVARLLAEGMGGTLEYRRTGDETRFSVVVPLAEAPVAPSAEPLP